MPDKITNIYAREVLDSRGDPTVEVTVEAGDISAKAKVPSGASTGKTEACELRDNDKERYGGKGVLKAIGYVNNEINKVLTGRDVDALAQIDQRLIDLDGSENKSRLGANAILGVSLACARVAAISHKLPLYRFIKEYYKFKQPFKLPVPLANLINGGLHADNNLDLQEFWVIPRGIKTFKERTRAVSEIFHQLGKILIAKGYDTDLGNEGGYAPELKNTEEVWQLLIQATAQAGYKIGQEIFLGLDAGSSTFYDSKSNRYLLKMENRSLTAEELSLVYQAWLAKYPIVAFEDPFAEEDWGAWTVFFKKISSINPDILLIGDDLFTTNTIRLSKGITAKAANAILIKPNQIGTLTETVSAIKMGQEANFKIAVSHRSGETEDDFIADLAVATAADFVKIGSTARSERIVKYNRLMEIEEELNIC